MYIQFMQKYYESGHMPEVKHTSNDVEYFLPHHCVIRDKSGSK